MDSVASLRLNIFILKSRIKHSSKVSVYSLIQIYVLSGHPLGEKDQMVDALSTLKERLKKSDPNVLFSVVNDLSKVTT